MEEIKNSDKENALSGKEKCCSEENEKGKSCCSAVTENGKRKTLRSEEQKKCLTNRLSRIEGQIRGIKKMIADDSYCADILIQSAAVTSAMNSFNKELLSDHIRGCVARDIKNGNDETVDELCELIKKLMKR